MRCVDSARAIWPGSNHRQRKHDCALRCSFKTHGPMKWPFVSSSCCEVAFSQREGWRPPLLRVCVDPADSISVIKCRFWPEEPGGWPFNLFFWFISTKTELFVKMYRFTVYYLSTDHVGVWTWCRLKPAVVYSLWGTSWPTNNKRLTSQLNSSYTVNKAAFWSFKEHQCDLF